MSTEARIFQAHKLPPFLREHQKRTRQCAAEGLGHVGFLAPLAEMELIDRERRRVERRNKAARNTPPEGLGLRRPMADFCSAIDTSGPRTTGK